MYRYMADGLIHMPMNSTMIERVFLLEVHVNDFYGHL